MTEKDTDKLIRNIIKGRIEVYYLVTERNLNNLKTHSAFGDLFFLFASLSFAGYISRPEYTILLFPGIVFLALAVYYYYLKFSFIRDIKTSGEVKSLNTEAKAEEVLKGREELRIIQANYGTPSNSIDVTQRLNELIQNGRLTTVASNELAGDPDVGVAKTLEVKYEHNGITITKKYSENEPVDLP